MLNFIFWDHKFDSDKLGRSLEMNGSNGYKFKYEAHKDARSEPEMDNCVAIK
uniref:Uncharacterized protein n=1 Tax=Helianthus annuus TaxID=4232 RepID=A0A251U847_HELAN